MPRKKIAVAGATGRVGRHAVDVLETQGHEVVAISRANGVDVITGDGLNEALAGVEIVIDAATGPSPDEQAATEFFTTAARNLQETGQWAGVQRIVVVSIIGADRFSAGYNVAKVAHEQAHLSGPIPAQVLRAAQFHEFVEQVLDWGRRGDVAYVMKAQTQLVAARTVAEALAEVATGESTISEIAGPRVESFVEMARLFAARSGDPVRVEGSSDPDDPDRELFEQGGLLPGPGARLAGPTYAEWLEAASAAPATNASSLA
jgi:uncharacterized protein YbjT (DUF2867 family)